MTARAAAVEHLEWLDAWWENYGPCGAIPGAVFPRELTAGRIAREYPAPPDDAFEVPDHAYDAWRVVMCHLAGLGAWLECFHREPGIWPQLELEVGHDVLCTARYDAEGDCHELAGCVLLDDEEIPAARCTCPYMWFDRPAPGVPNAQWGHWAILINVYCWHHGDRWLG